jgi:hypothetical protein
MGFRTVVILNNDHCGKWENDPELGRKISRAMNDLRGTAANLGGMGRVVECCHADSQTLAVIDSLTFTPLAYDLWVRNEREDAVVLKMLRQAADRKGYRLVRKTKKGKK